MHLRKVLFLLAFTTALPAYGTSSTFSEDDFPFQHECMPSSDDSDCDVRIAKGYDDDKWAEAEKRAKRIELEAFRGECEGIKLDEKDPYAVAKSIVIRVSSFYRAKLRWIVRRKGTDKALTTFIECYHPGKLPEAEQQRFENFKVAGEFTVESLVRETTDAYLSMYLGAKENPSMSLTALLAGDLPNFRYNKSLPDVFSKEEMMAFITQFLPSLKGGEKVVSWVSDQAYAWMVFAYEKACIYFMRDFIEALRTSQNVHREPFKDFIGQPISQLYMEVKPIFKKGYRPKDDKISGFRGREFDRFDVRQGKHLMPRMNDLFCGGGHWGVLLEPNEEVSAPDGPGADDEEQLEQAAVQTKEDSEEDLFTNTFAWADTSE